jgi:hypothetical protein
MTVAMNFLDETRLILRESVFETAQRIKDYVPRVLVREGTDRSVASQLRSLRRLALPETERKLLEDAQVTSRPRLAIIGDPGSGKSYIVQNAFLKAAHAFLMSSDAPLPCFLDLARHLSRQYSVKEMLEEALHRRYRGLFERISSEHKSGCILFLDALDERLLAEKNPFDFVNGLLAFIDDYQLILHGVVIACRRVVWNPEWFRDPRIPWEIYHTDYLDFEDYGEILPDPATRKAFFDHADSLGISDLLRLPFIGFNLARRYDQGQSLPVSRQAWFREHIETALKSSKSDQERGQAPPTETLIFLVRQLACLATFGQVAGWTVQEAIDQLGASRVVWQERSSITHQDIQTLFERPLFTKMDGRFSFSHQLFREYLAAEALSPLPLRKQRQLLETSFPSLGHRIVTPQRGVAIFLAERSSPFCEYLILSDPLVAFLTDVPSLRPETSEKLTQLVMDKAIVDHRAPWWEIPPRGERPSDFLIKHQPSDVAGFLRSYLERSDEVSLLWATACAAAWGGSISINNHLIDLAHNNELNVEIRKNAVDAVFATGDVEDIRRLYDLLHSPDDQVRGHVLYAYRVTESPAPSDYIAKLYGGAHSKSLICLLQLEVSWFGLSLDVKELGEAFEVVSACWEEVGDLLPRLLEGLFRRALQLSFDGIPPSLIVQLWVGHDTRRAYYEKELKELVSNNSQLFSRIWNYVLYELGGRESGFLYYPELARALGEVCNDQIFELIPADRNLLNRYQDALVSGVLGFHFQKDLSPERLQEFKERAPTFTAHFRLSRPALDAASRDQLQSRRKIAEVLNRQELKPIAKCSHLLQVVGQTLHDDDRQWVEAPEVTEFLKEDMSAPLLKRVLEVFAACVYELSYSREPADSPNTFKMTHPEFAVPFWVLWSFGVKFSAGKLDEFIRCYAFSGLHPSAEPELYYPLLDKLRNLDLVRWEESIIWLIEFPHTTAYCPLEYLTARESDLYLERCRQRLLQCDFSVGDFNSLINYWIARRPSDFEPVLRACYECIDREEDRTELLYVLLTDDSDWAWQALHRLIETGTPPRREPSSSHRPLRLPRNPSRLPVLADWYAHLRGSRVEHKEGWGSSDIEHLLIAMIVTMGGEEAIEQLKRLQRENAFPGAEWLSYEILRIEDQMLSMTDKVMEPARLIDFVNRDALGVVLNQRDLFEWVCQAIEDIQERLERQAAQVHGYWNRHDEEWEPKTEPECQNVFWPTVRDRLANLGIVGVEERSIRAHKVDLWVEKPLGGGQPACVAIELKVARKGYGYKHLVKPLETQLWRKYLEPSGCRHGIHVVLWFKDRARYPYPTSWEAPSELLEELDQLRCQIMEQHGVSLACYVIDLTTVTRMH